MIIFPNQTILYYFRGILLYKGADNKVPGKLDLKIKTTATGSHFIILYDFSDLNTVLYSWLKVK